MNQLNDQQLDQINQLRRIMEQLQEDMKNIRESRATSQRNKTKYEKQIEAEAVAIRFYDNQLSKKEKQYTDTWKVYTEITGETIIKK